MADYFKSDSIAAGAYKGKDVSERTLREHIVCTGDVKIGRLNRKAYQALCNPKLDTVGYLREVERADCPRCKEIYGSIKEIRHGTSTR